MKKTLFTLAVTLCTIQSTLAQEIPEYTKTVDGIIEKLYASISGEKGEHRDWEAFDQLFIPEARLIPTSSNQEGGKSYQVYTPTEYRENANQWLVENGFYEIEINRVAESYGPMVHMFSTYISKRSKSDPEPYNRGINSIQLYNDGERWWIVSIYWAHEPDNAPLPAEYLPERTPPQKEQSKIPVYAWLGGPGSATDEEIQNEFEDLKSKGIDALMYNGGQDPEVYRRVGKIAQAAGLEFHTWIPTMVQSKKPEIEADWYAINGLGESALEKPAYVDYYKFLCPSKQGTYDYLESMYTAIADVEQVDAIHLDYIRFPDVILARGLWEKYGLVMDREYPQYDYCYCDDCTGSFEAETGIDISSVEDPSQVEEWKQFRYDLITSIVNRLVEAIHAQGKQVNAAVFPGPNSIAKKIVRQEWNNWNLDAFFPMNYNDFYLEGTDWIGSVTKEAVNSVPGKPVYSGLFICPDPAKKATEPDPENHGLVPEELGEAVRQSMENGATGICLFTPGRMTEEHWMELQKAIYK